jgi:hypothetical protein
VRAEAHEAFDAPKITNINQLLIPYRGRKAVVQLANQIMGRLIIASQYLAFRKPDGGIQRPSFQLGKEERA